MQDEKEDSRQEPCQVVTNKLSICETTATKSNDVLAGATKLNFIANSTMIKLRQTADELYAVFVQLYPYMV